MNVTVVTGHLSRPPELKTLPSGAVLVAFDVTVARPGQRAESVPVVWPEAQGASCTWPAGEAVLAVGRVRRRFFRAGGATQSRTEVVAEVVVPLRRAAAVRRALDAVGGALASGAAELPTSRPRRRGEEPGSAQVRDAS